MPLDIVEYTPEGPRLMLVDAEGNERPGPEPAEADLAWLARWWPERGGRAEVGRSRDEAWARLVGRLEARGRRRRRLLPRRGDPAAHSRRIPPRHGGLARPRRVLRRHRARRAGRLRGARPGDRPHHPAGGPARLGVSGRRPDRELAFSDPRAYLAELSRAGEAAELTDPDGLGGFGWLMQAKGPVSLERHRTQGAAVPPEGGGTAVFGTPGVAG